MFCPNCGKECSLDQRFCRSCGIGLEKVSMSLAEQLPLREELSLQAQKERLERWGVAALSVFGLGVLGILLYVSVWKLIVVQGTLLGGLAALGLLLMGGCGLAAVYLFAKAKEVEQAAAKRRIEPAAEVEPAPPTGRLLVENMPQPASVTEGTTDLLYEERGGGRPRMAGRERQ